MAGSPFTYPFLRVRDYLHALRVSAEQTRDEVRASRVELAGHLTRLEELASTQLELLEQLAAAEAARSSEPADES